MLVGARHGKSLSSRAWLDRRLARIPVGAGHSGRLLLSVASNHASAQIRASGTGFRGLLMLGPLLGYGFLAGATVDLPDDVGPPRRGWRRLAARRSVWVAIGPWWGRSGIVRAACSRFALSA